jgi:solute carrier family 25 (mitochondrial carnitine/acylcarnitine transporter), member 20/29
MSSSSEKRDVKTVSPFWSNSKWFISGAVSGMANTLAGHPLDTLKIRLQTEGVHGRFNGVMHCLKTTIVEEGFFRGLYKGLTPPFFGMGIINMMMFGIFGNVKKFVGNNLNNGNLNLTIPQTAIAGAITGPLVSIVVVPVEQVKARLQVQYALPKGFKNSFNTFS